MNAVAEPLADLIPPRYDGASLLNLAATLAAVHGAVPAYPLLADEKLRRPLLQSRRLVLWLIDGLGVEPLRQLAPRSALAAALRGELEAIFPSSTAPTLTMLATGCSPAVHAAPEWFLWLDELGAIYRALPLDARDTASGRPPIAEAASIYPQPSLTAGSPRRCFAVLPESICESTYSRYAHAGATRLGFRDAAGFVDAVTRAVDAGGDDSYVFAYVDAFDAAAHEFGVGSDAAHAVVQTLDRVFAQLSEALAARGALLAVTADHGFLDVPPARRFDLAAFGDIATCLERPLTGGPRAPLLHVKPEQREAFPALIESALGEHFVAVPSRKLAAAGWFGPEPPAAQDSRLLSRLGSHVLLPRSDAYFIDVLPSERTPKLIGMHGGRAPAETRVPLILAGCAP